MKPEIAILLEPISMEKPAGDNLEFEHIYDEIRLSRESDPEYLLQDEWAVNEPRRANWKKVHDLSEQVLRERSKDLQIACWYAESFFHQQGLIGAITGLEYLQEFIICYWYQCWPLLDDGVQNRRSKLLRLDRDLAQQLFIYSLLEKPQSSLSYWKQILSFEYRINTRPELRDTLLLQEGDLTMATFEQLATSFSSSGISEQICHVEKLISIIIDFEENYSSLSKDTEGPVFLKSRQMLTDIVDFLQRLAKRGMPLSDNLPSVATTGSKITDDSFVSLIDKGMLLLTSREQAIDQMIIIANYFKQNEPSSPVPFLIERAARWANMDISEWLEEMLKNDNAVHEINKVLKGNI